MKEGIILKHWPKIFLVLCLVIGAVVAVAMIQVLFMTPTLGEETEEMRLRMVTLVGHEGNKCLLRFEFTHSGDVSEEELVKFVKRFGEDAYIIAFGPTKIIFTVPDVMLSGAIRSGRPSGRGIDIRRGRQE